jgi:hypothetical protein
MAGQQSTPPLAVPGKDRPGWVGHQDVGLAGADGEGDGLADALRRIGRNPRSATTERAGSEPLVELGCRDRGVDDRNRHARSGHLEPTDLGEHVHGALPEIRIRHPQLGPIELYHQKLEIPDTGGQILGLLYAEPGSKSEQAVAMLAATIGEPNAAQSRDHPARRAQTPAEPA